ncbi:hypothetical protein [Candidatus Phycosocius spiralis]|uniref:Cellulose biosynthesis protein BcsS n=1 Tax=Candidatus Phycosocius spiralis TaxID=2815099 RepID=A0ABQ4PSP8_9PROT|nr:hypothetical protein [Candidatus Phycosocius spiralis]GIU66034.1 hypothetical protein PsB1_0188 [Candidatus Phycosocius spiralis]
MLLFSSLALAAGGQAHGGAWVGKRGDGAVIINAVSLNKDQTPRGYSLELYGEVGLGHELALVGAPSISQGVQAVSSQWSVDEVLVGLRRNFYRGHSFALSYQISTFTIPTSVGSKTSEIGIETRFALGKNLGHWGWLNGEVAGRTCGISRGIRYDATGGVKLPKGDMLIVKIFGDGNGCALPLTRSQMSYVSPLFGATRLEIGWRTSLGEEKINTDQGLILGLWRVF